MAETMPHRVLDDRGGGAEYGGRRGGFVGGLDAAAEETGTDGSPGAARVFAAPADDAERDRSLEDPGPAFTVRRRVGRLLEIRILHLRHVDQLLTLSTTILKEARALPSRAIVFGDFRRTRPFSQDVADRWSRDMRGYNVGLALSGILLAPWNATFNLQIERVIRCAGNPWRRTFYDVRELRSWVAIRATSDELERLDHLLSLGDP
jgi:hypothetical protein